jgi:hypothetical protein
VKNLRRTEGEPHDRLTRLCAAMTDELQVNPDYTSEIKCVVFLVDGKQVGLQLFNYDDDLDAAVDLLFHLRAIFEANGKTLMLVPVGSG